ncbi:MAG: tRNA lysidine(34) synthetase TilS [Planctomycetota bacterium]
MDSFTRLLDTCAKGLSRYENVSAQGPVLAAVSGGVDSTLLLFLLARLRDEDRLPADLVCAHVDHAVRPDSRQNAQHVVDLCDRLDVPVAVRRLSWPDSGSWPDSAVGPAEPNRPADPRDHRSEGELREARYQALADMAQQFGSRLLVTGHHADDNLETVLFRMLRGTGPRGLAGIPEARWLEHGTRNMLVVRPLLRTRRTTIESQLARLGESACHDSSNDDLRYSRNRLRHETIPALREQLGIGLDVAVMTVASTARAANEIIEAQGLRVLTQRARQRTAWRLELDLRQLDPDALPFVREALRQAHTTLHPHGEAPSTSWLDRATALLEKHDGKRVAGRGGLLVERIRDGLLLVDTDRAGEPPARRELASSQQLAADTGRQRFGNTEWLLEAHSHPLPPLVPSPSEAGPMRALIHPEACPGPWRLRTRQPGDRFWPLGHQEGEIDLRRFLQSRHVPRFDRDRLPLVVDDNDRILWIPGVELAHHARLRLNTKACIEIQARIG